MATQTTTVRDFCALLAKSRLLPPEEVEAVHRKWLDDGRGADDQVDRFRKYLVSRRHLTDWQGHMVQRGRADGFFLGGYKILDRIGKGQMGGVYKAVHTLGQIVALKILPASKARDQHLLGRFQREARLLTQLDHPNVVRSYQFGEEGGVHFIGMEFLEGETLDDVLLRRGRLPWAEAVRIAHQTLNGLQHLHERRMVHRDLKPANLMLTPGLAAGRPDATWDATVKILDIGLGRELFDDATPEGQIETQLTVEGSVLGTPDYLAPEQARDARSSDIRADVYSLGCVLYHALAGRPPFPETNIMTQMLLHATEMPAPLAESAPDVPPGLQPVMDRLLAKSPDDRYPTPAAAAAALAAFIGTHGTAPAPALMVPEYKAWLESESQLGVPTPPPAKPTPAPVPAPKPRTPPAIPAPPAAGRTDPVVVVPLGNGPPAGPKPAPGRPVLVPVPVPDEVDVELVAAPPAPADRPLTDLDRRDWIMLAAGAAGVLAAVGLGYGLARVVRKKPEEVPEDG
jgi:serine/threonine protein kinase